MVRFKATERADPRDLTRPKNVLRTNRQWRSC